MKELNKYILEKLVIGNNLDNPYINIKPADSKLRHKINYSIQYNSKTNKYEIFYNHIQKMKEYMNKGSKPERLIATIKDNTKLLNRWMAAVELKWDDAILAFGQAIEDRNLFTLEELHSYILSGYNKDINNQNESDGCIQHYLDLYNINY